MEERDYYLGFALCKGIGPTRFGDLLHYFKSAENAWNASVADLKNAGLGDQIIPQFLENKQKIDIPSYKQFLSSKNIHFIASIDKKYSHRLVEKTEVTIGLFTVGNIDLLSDNNVMAVVGTRKMTGYGKMVTEKLVKELVSFGYIVVSGLALGVDSVAHKTVLENKGKTIAVLGCGVDCCYPRENQRIYERIVQNNGLIISEYPPGMLPSKGTFPARNKIIAGISDGVLVTEAGLESGSLITAEFAKISGGKVYAVPGNIGASVSRGTLYLIKNGAILVEGIEDIVGPYQDSGKKDSINFEACSLEEKRLISLLIDQSRDVDQLAQLSGMSISVLNTVLMQLEINGVIKNCGNLEYSLA